MKIYEVIKLLKAMAVSSVDDEHTCDVIKAGSDERCVTKLAISMFATPEVIKKASEWGAELLVVHEPVFYDHMDRNVPSKIGFEKKKLIDDSKLTIFRFHDYAHSAEPDLIYAGQMKALGLEGKYEKGKYFAVNKFILDKEMTARELGAHIEKSLGIKHVRIAGCLDKKGKSIACCFGTPGHVIEMLEENDFVLTGEICEWCEGEIARDFAQLGYNKAIIVMGHIGSEREGMKLLSELVDKCCPDVEKKYFECSELYSYTETSIFDR